MQNRYDITGRALPVFVYRPPAYGGRRVRLLPPTQAAYDRICMLLPTLVSSSTRTPDTIRALYDTVGDILRSNIDGYATDPADIRRRIGYTEAIKLLTEFVAWFSDILNEPRFRCPAAPADDDAEETPLHYDVATNAARAVSEYAGLSVLEALELNVVDFRILRRDAFIFRLSGHKEGREYLHKCWCFEQTEPDRTALRAAFGGRKGRS